MPRTWGWVVYPKIAAFQYPNFIPLWNAQQILGYQRPITSVDKDILPLK